MIIMSRSGLKTKSQQIKALTNVATCLSHLNTQITDQTIKRPVRDK